MPAAQGAAGAGWPALFLPAEQAFAYFISCPPRNRGCPWQIAPDYYMYQDKFAFTLLHNGNPVSSTPTLPQAVPHNDEYFGDVQVLTKSPHALADRHRWPVDFCWSFRAAQETGFCYTLQRREEVLPL
ncbi:MAG: protein-disulfide reductase DsbD family protein [Gammaproteobacteria bacterium]